MCCYITFTTVLLCANYTDFSHKKLDQFFRDSLNNFRRDFLNLSVTSFLVPFFLFLESSPILLNYRKQYIKSNFCMQYTDRTVIKNVSSLLPF